MLDFKMSRRLLLKKGNRFKKIVRAKIRAQGMFIYVESITSFKFLVKLFLEKGTAPFWDRSLPC